MTKQRQLFNFVVRLGDSTLIAGHRLSQWCSKAHSLEEDIALVNIALDLIGQATNWLEYAATLEGKGQTADQLAYLRDAVHFRSCLLVQQENGDFAFTMMKQYLFDVFQNLIYEALCHSSDAHIAAIASKSLKESAYHLRHSSQWLKRLAGGTAESLSRTQYALDTLWKYTADLFEQETNIAPLVAEGILPDYAALQAAWQQIQSFFQENGLTIPEKTVMLQGSTQGRHSEALGYILAEMQFLPRAYPNAQW